MRRRDPWDVVALPIVWAVIGVLEVRERLRLHLERSRAEASGGTGTEESLKWT
jgi:hypothetical protein